MVARCSRVGELGRCVYGYGYGLYETNNTVELELDLHVALHVLDIQITNTRAHTNALLTKKLSVFGF